MCVLKVPRKCICCSKEKIWTSPSNSVYSSHSRYEISFKTDNFDFPKRVFPIQVKTNDRCDNIQRIIFVLGTNLDSSSRKDSSSQRSKFKHHHRIQHIRITFNTNFPSWTNNFVFLDSIFPKRVFPAQSRTN